MLSTGLPAVAVCGAGNRFVGVVSDRDILERVVAAGRDPQLVSVAGLVGGDRPVIVPDRPVDRSVLALLLRQRLALLPVVDDGRLLGVLHLADVTDHLLEEADRVRLPGTWMRGGRTHRPATVSALHRTARKRTSVDRRSRPCGHLAFPACVCGCSSQHQNGSLGVVADNFPRLPVETDTAACCDGGLVQPRRTFPDPRESPVPTSTLAPTTPHDRLPYSGPTFSCAPPRERGRRLRERFNGASPQPDEACGSHVTLLGAPVGQDDP